MSKLRKVCKLRKTSKLGFRGISVQTGGNKKTKFKAVVYFRLKGEDYSIYLGVFNTVEEAVEVRKQFILDLL